MKLVTVEEMRTIDKETDAVGGVSYAELMENAGRGVADIVLEFAYSQKDVPEIVGLTGPGNNGGDTLVALSHLAAEGWRATAYISRRTIEGDPLVERLRDAGGEIILADEDEGFARLVSLLQSADAVLDGFLGTGIRLPLRGQIAEALRVAKETILSLESPPLVVAVDCPSGVDSDTGDAAEQVIPADVTATMAAVKKGLVRLPAFSLAGQIVIVDIGVTDKTPAWVKIRNFVADEEMVAARLPERPADAHKGTFGTAMIVAGSVNYTGAALLAGKSAYYAGAGLVTLATPAPLHDALAGHFPEATWLLLPHEMGVIAADAADVLLKNLNRATALLIGPGFGLEETTRQFIESVLAGKAAARPASIGFLRDDSSDGEGESASLPPLIFDADGLKLLAKIESWWEKLPAPAILTPHPGEMSVLTGLSTSEIQENREKVAREYAEKWGHVVVLKGAFTLVAAPDGRVTLIPVASAALARAGTGDVLAGLIAGLRAQGMDAYDAALAGAWIHAQAGVYAADAYGQTASVLAGDVLEAIPGVLADIMA